MVCVRPVGAQRVFPAETPAQHRILSHLQATLECVSPCGRSLQWRVHNFMAWNPVYSVSPTLNLGPSNPRAQPTALRWRRPTSGPFFRRWSLVRHVDVRKGFGDFNRQLKNYSKLVRLCPCVSPMLQAKAPPSAESRADLNHRGLAGPPRTAFPHFVPYAQEVA